MKIKINLDVLRFKKEQAQTVINWLLACVDILQAIEAHQDIARLDHEGIEVLAPEGVTMFNELGEEQRSILFYPEGLADLLAAVEKVERKA
jgi:hypothetical protein